MILSSEEYNDGPMQCEERERLAKIYLAAIAKDKEKEAQANVANSQEPATWTPTGHEEALMALYQHRVEHGC
jgi:hypothetical protein